MRLDLRRARRLETAIQALITQLQHSVSYGSTTLSVYEDASETISKKNEEILETLRKTVELTKARFIVRELISKAKADQINDLIAQEAMTGAVASLYDQAIASRCITQNDEKLAKHKLAAIAKANVNSDMPTHQYDIYQVLRESVHAEISVQSKKLKALQVSLRDQIASANSSTFIELPTSVEDIINQHEIIV